MFFFDLVKVHALLGKPVEELSKLEKWGLFLSYARAGVKKIPGRGMLNCVLLPGILLLRAF